MPKATQSAKDKKATKKAGAKKPAVKAKALARGAAPPSVDELLALAADLRAAATDLDAKATAAPEPDKPQLWAKADELRWNAQDVYTKAAELAVSEIAPFVAEVTENIADARKVIKKIDKMKAILEIAGDLIHIAAAITAKKVGPLKAWLKELRNDLAQYRKA
jgi:hypothetical protein